MTKINLKALTDEQLDSFVAAYGLSPYRAKQIRHWIYSKGAVTLSEITELPLAVRQSLSEHCYISALNLVDRQQSVDQSEKFLFALEDGETVESVLIPEQSRCTLCISSQVGCAMGCRFCLTGKMGFKRNLLFFEIVDQALAVQKIAWKSHSVTNIVFMGMGEPFMNMDEIKKALTCLLNNMNFSKRKITVSTSGVVPGIYELSNSRLGVNLAVSLNATTDKIRDAIMPVNRKYPLASLLEACRAFRLPPNRRIAFEYVLIKDINDTEEDAERLWRLLNGIRSKVNLIPFNPFSGTAFERPSDERVAEFQEHLAQKGITVMVRKSRGADILAACGQLRGKAMYSLPV